MNRNGKWRAFRSDRLQKLSADGIHPLAMDVTDDASMQAGIEEPIAETRRIDVLVNNDGYGSYGAPEDADLDEGRRQFEVNVFGAIRLAQLALPHMRTQGLGTIVNITSMGGKIYTPLGGWYHGTKFALEALSDCLRLEVKPFGIDVVVIEPGGIATEWGGITGDLVEQTSGHGCQGGVAGASGGRAARSRRRSRGAVLPGSPTAARVGACGDNAAMESFFALLQKNVLDRPMDPVMPLFSSTRRKALERIWAPRSLCRIVPSMLRWPIAFRAAATARDAFILESIE